MKKKKLFRRRMNIHKNSVRSEAIVKANRQLISSCVCLFLSVALLLMSGETFAWFAIRWGSSETQNAFSSAYSFTPNLVMWTYDTEAETGAAGKWTCKYSDCLAGRNVTEEKGIPKIGSITASGSDTVFTADIQNLTFGEINDLVNQNEDNDVYFRFSTDVVSVDGDEASLIIRYPADYVQCFAYAGTLNSGTDVTDELNATLAAEDPNDSLSNTALHQYFTVQYMVLPVGYIRDLNASAENIMNPIHFIRTYNDLNNKRDFRPVTSYTEGEEYYVFSGVSDSLPNVGSIWYKDYDACALAENQPLWQTLSPDTDTAAITVPVGTVRYYIYVKLSPNLSDNGLRTILKNLYRYMPCYLTFDLNMSIEIAQIGEEQE